MKNIGESIKAHRTGKEPVYEAMARSSLPTSAGSVGAAMCLTCRGERRTDRPSAAFVVAFPEAMALKKNLSAGAVCFSCGDRRSYVYALQHRQHLRRGDFPYGPGTNVGKDIFFKNGGCFLDMGG